VCAQLLLPLHASTATARCLFSSNSPSMLVHLCLLAGQGGCFPIHTDTDAAVDSRRVTAIWYLNPGWRQGDGGELRLYPFPRVGSGSG
jgi:Rps23 Pro-64 3,4-dihydroxylase Tpa1-like proline 4-hydroxylase